jgi:hypothetical protein
MYSEVSSTARLRIYHLRVPRIEIQLIAVAKIERRLHLLRENDGLGSILSCSPWRPQGDFDVQIPAIAVSETSTYPGEQVRLLPHPGMDALLFQCQETQDSNRYCHDVKAE